jgi:hypothetical protein
MPSLPPIVPQGSVRPIPLRSLVPSLSDRTFVPPQSFLCMEAFWNAIDTGLGLSATKAEELNTLQVCFRAVVVYLVLIGFIRFAKKRFLSQATAFDVILVIVIGSISSRAVSGTAPFLPSLAGTFVLISHALDHLVFYSRLQISGLPGKRQGYRSHSRRKGRCQGDGRFAHVGR